MTEKSRYQSQQKIKELNRNLVLSALQDGQKRFKELKEITKLSPMGLTNILGELEEKENLIERKADGRWSAYILSKKGERTLERITTLDFIINRILDNGGKHHHDYSELKSSMDVAGVPWGIRDDLVFDKNINEKSNPLPNYLVGTIQSRIFRDIQTAVKKNLISLDKTKKGQIVLGFVIDYKDLAESVQNDSLSQYNKIIENEKLGKADKWQRSKREMEDIGPI